MSSDHPTDATNELEAQKHQLENAVAHLCRSNAELKEAIAAEGDSDRTFKEAIEENIVIIAKYRARIESLEKEIDNMRKGFINLGNQATIAVEGGGGGGGGGRREGDGNHDQDQGGVYL